MSAKKGWISNPGLGKVVDVNTLPVSGQPDTSSTVSLQTVYFDRPIVPGRVVDILDAGETITDKALFIVHGGGWSGGTRTDFHEIAQAFREKGFDVASTDYRLRGVNVFQQVEDVRIGLELFAQDLRRRGRAKKIVLIGSSAGAHLALLAGMSPFPTPPSYEVAGICVQAAPCTFEPWEDIFPQIWAAMQNIVGVSFAENPEAYRQASPIAHLRAETPPVLFLHAQNEHMFPLTETQRFIERARELGVTTKLVEYPNMEHGFFYALNRRQQREAFAEIVEFVQTVAR